MTPAIFGLSGPELTPDERAFFAAAQPAGYLLYEHNLVDRAQIRALTDDLRALAGRDDLPILIDQEGGRVTRLGPPQWPAFPAGVAFDALYAVAPSSAIAAARANGEALGAVLADVGITVDCAPMLDVRRPGTTDAIGDRAFGSDALQVAAIGRATLDGLAAAGVVGVVKHMPGHGRATADSHLELPVVVATATELEEDIRPFRTLAAAPMGMTCHVVFQAWDAERPATHSPVVIRDIIRGRIGFAGLLMSDDLDMKALPGTPTEKAARAIAAGCDVVLDGWSRIDDLRPMVEAIGPISDAAMARLDRAMSGVATADRSDDLAGLIAKRDTLLALA